MCVCVKWTVEDSRHLEVENGLQKDLQEARESVVTLTSQSLELKAQLKVFFSHAKKKILARESVFTLIY